MKISVFGNKDYAPDSTPLKILPELIKQFPEFVFVAEDPNELNIPDEKEWWIIDTVRGLEDVQVIEMDELKKLPTSHVSMHDFDLGTHLFWVKKLNKNTKIHIIGVPPHLSQKVACDGVSMILKKIKNNQK